MSKYYKQVAKVVKVDTEKLRLISQAVQAFLTKHGNCVPIRNGREQLPFKNCDMCYYCEERDDVMEYDMDWWCDYEINNDDRFQAFLQAANKCNACEAVPDSYVREAAESLVKNGALDRYRCLGTQGGQTYFKIKKP